MNEQPSSSPSRPTRILQIIVLGVTLVVVAYVGVVAEFPGNLLIGLGLVLVNLAVLRVFFAKKEPESSSLRDQASQAEDFVD